MSDDSSIEAPVIFDENGVAYVDEGYHPKKNSYIGVSMKSNDKVGFYETYTPPTDTNNVFTTFEEAKRDAIGKWENRLATVQKQLDAIKDTGFSEVIPLGTEGNLHG